MSGLFRTLCLAATLCWGVAAGAQESAGDRPVVFVALGTSGGPVPNPFRSQPANALVVGDDIILVDAGDGVVGQLAKAGFRLDRVRSVFLSHLHLDHTAGLAGVIGLRWMNSMQGHFRVYGPPGTRAMVNGIVASIEPARAAGFGFHNGFGSAPLSVDVVEIADNSGIQVLPGVTATSVENSHYSFRPDSPEARASKALSFRFEAPGRSIVYTGDTGTSEAVTRLARGADLLVSEVQDLPALQRAIAQYAPNMPRPAYDNLMEHLRLHHVSPEEVGTMARTAGVDAVVLTHLSPGPDGAEAEALYLPALRRRYEGPVTVAVDLGQY